jgi:GAF domain/HD domain
LRFDRSFDDRRGYRTRSMLVVPMRTPQGDTLGVFQLINCKPGFRGRLASRSDIDRHVRPFSRRHEELAASLASQAAVALHNRQLYEDIRTLFEGFVKASVTAIESRDPATSGHSFRVADLTVALAEAVNRLHRGPYATTRFTASEVMELRYASLLHDFGKVGVREQVLVKAKKLYPADLDRIRHRAELLKRDLELCALDLTLGYLRASGEPGYRERAARVDAELAACLDELDADLDLVVLANEPSIRLLNNLSAVSRRFTLASPPVIHRPASPRNSSFLSAARSLQDDGIRWPSRAETAGERVSRLCHAISSSCPRTIPSCMTT